MATAFDQTAAFGTDVSTQPGLDPYFGPLSGTRVVAESLARRLATPRGSLPEDPDFGFDVVSSLSDTFDPATIRGLQIAIENECEKDARVQSATCTASFNVATQTLSVAIVCVAINGVTFDFVLNISAVTVDLILGNTP